MERLYAAVISKNNKVVDRDVGTVLNIINTCDNMHVLPYPGGLFDQDALFMLLYDHVAHARSIRAELDKNKAPSS